MSELNKNDHREIGRELDLFTFSDLVGSGLPLWTPKGTIVREELDKFVWELRSKHEYGRVTIPHITKKDLYETSGHWDKFSEELFRITSREGREMALKPMNCPHHTQIFARKPHSYREMPQRYAETTMVYRDEQSGELGGLTRVLSITQDDSHVFCRTSQIKEEFMIIWDVVDSFYKIFGFTLRVRLSFRDPKEPQKYLGTKEIWDKAEKELTEIAEERRADFFEGQGEAALYGPKLDFMAKNSAGREWQVATIQLDMNLPDRFDLVCINEKGEKERIVMIHSAITGSLERCTAVLLEHFEGVLPTWLSPVQVRLLPISEKHNDYAKKVYDNLIENGIRTEIDQDNETLGKKIRDAKLMKIPYLLVIGDKEVESNQVTVESRQGNEGSQKLEKFLEKIQKEIKERN
ncbi:MAG: threonine--tRNA ligase [Patescibacteria group bacterium]